MVTPIDTHHRASLKAAGVTNTVSYPLGVDYSAGKISGAALAAAGVTFAIRYTDEPGAWGTKHTNREEYRDLVAHGIRVYLVVEHATGDQLTGRSGGQAMARRGLAGAAALGYPTGMPIFLTADAHVISSDIPRAVDYFRGGQDVLGRAAGGYGFSEMIDALVAAGVCTWYWQPGSRSAVRSATHVYQCNDVPNLRIGGIACDVNELRRPLPTTTIGGVAVTPSEITAIAKGVAAELADNSAYLSAVRQQVAILLADPTHQYLQDELSPLKASGTSILTAIGQTQQDVTALGTAVTALQQAVGAMPAGGAPGGTLDPAVLARAFLDELVARVTQAPPATTGTADQVNR